MLSRGQAEQYGQISGAEVGLMRLGGGRRFADEFFDTKTGLYEPVEFTDLQGTRYLARKLKDVAPRVPTLQEIRPEVALAWKMERARPLAQKAADQLADQLKKQGGVLKEGMAGGYRVVKVPPIPRRQSTAGQSRYEMERPLDTPMPEVVQAGDAVRDAYYSLQTGSVAVAANQPQTIYYVMTLDRREPATFAALYAPYGEELRYRLYATRQAGRQLADQWMGWLRQQAGVTPDWVPADEAKGESSRRQG
jgi:peptidyl-prolyl cis-trans isomerase D